MDKDALQYKDACEKCGAALTWVSPAFVCSFECTFCPECTDELAGVCPNCSGELRKRPARTQPVGRRKL